MAYESLGRELDGKFKQFATDRSADEQRWLKAARQRAGEYDPGVVIDKDKSHAYPRITRMKCRSMVARIMNLMFQGSDKNWFLTASPLPELHPDDEQRVLSDLQAAGVEMSDEIIEEAIREFAKARARNLELLVEDQLTTATGHVVGGYEALAKRVLESGTTYGVGVLHGPLIEERKTRTWKRAPDGTVQKIEGVAYIPQYEFVPVWNYYWDTTCPDMHGVRDQFERFVLSKQELLDRAGRFGFDMDAVRAFLVASPNGNHDEKQHEADRASTNIDGQTRAKPTNKYDLLMYTGFVSYAQAKEAGLTSDKITEGDDVPVMVSMCGGRVFKAEIYPWFILDQSTYVPMYHHFIFEDSETTAAGEGLPDIIRDSQLAMANATRMMLDNLGVVAGPMAEINLDALHESQVADTKLAPFKTFLRTGNGTDAQIPAVREIRFDSHANELLAAISWFKQLADDEAMTAQGVTGDSQRGPGEAFRTAAGASMLRGDVALPFKDVVRSFDVFTSSVVGALLQFNRHFTTDVKYRGDAVVVCKGATSLVAKEVRGILLDQLAASLTPDDAIYVNRFELLKERLLSRDADFRGILCTKDEAKRREQAQAQSAAAAAQKQDEMIAAEIRETLSKAFKNMTAGDKNSAGADVMLGKQQLDTMERLNAAATPEDGPRPDDTGAQAE